MDDLDAGLSFASQCLNKEVQVLPSAYQHLLQHLYPVNDNNKFN